MTGPAGPAGPAAADTAEANAMATTPTRVVVGIGGGQRSVAVLRWAAYQAVRLDAELVAVHAYAARRRAATTSHRPGRRLTATRRSWASVE